MKEELTAVILSYMPILTNDDVLHFITLFKKEFENRIGYRT